MSVRVERVKHFIKEEISLIFMHKLKDPAFSLVTITDVVVTPDLKTAKIYISVFEKDKRDLVLGKINAINKTIRATLAQRINLKSAPELHFYIDDTIDYVEKIEDIFRKINNDNSSIKEN